MAPTKLPLSLAEAKDHLGVPHSEIEDDAQIDQMIRAAVRFGEKIAGDGVCLITQTWEQIESNWPVCEFKLRRGPVQSVSSISYKDDAGASQTLSASVYQTGLIGENRRARIKLDDGESWPTLGTAFYDPITITTVCGYGDSFNDVPEGLRRDLLDWIGTMFNDREAWAEKQQFPSPIAGAAFTDARLNWY